MTDVESELHNEGQLEEYEGQLEDRKLETASTEQVVSFLGELIQPVMDGQKERQVLMGNLIKGRERGERGPVREGRRVNALETPDGWRAVNNNGWTEAMRVFLVSQLGCKYFEVLKGAGMQTECSMKDGRLRQEIHFLTHQDGIHLLRVEEYNPESGAIMQLGIEILNSLNQDNQEPKES